MCKYTAYSSWGWEVGCSSFLWVLLVQDQKVPGCFSVLWSARERCGCEWQGGPGSRGARACSSSWSRVPFLGPQLWNRFYLLISQLLANPACFQLFSLGKSSLLLLSHSRCIGCLGEWGSGWSHCIQPGPSCEMYRKRRISGPGPGKMGKTMVNW